MPSASSSTAATGSLGSPIVRANTLVEPPGSTPSAVSVPAMPGRDLVQRAVAAEADDDVDAAAGGVVGEAGGVAAAVRLDELDVVVRGQPAVHDDRVAGRHRRRERVHDQQDPQGADGTSGLRAPSGGRLAGWGIRWSLGNNERAMNVIVCVKQIPDPAQVGRAGSLGQHAEA